MDELVLARPRNRMGDRLEIVDDRVILDPQFFLHEGGPDDPRVVGEADNFAADRTGNRHRHARGQRAAHAVAVIFPGGLETGVVFGVQGFRLAQAERAVIRDRGDGEAGMSAADIDADEVHHLQSCHG